MIELFVAKKMEIDSSVTLVDCYERETIIRGLQRVWCNCGSEMLILIVERGPETILMKEVDQLINIDWSKTFLSLQKEKGW